VHLPDHTLTLEVVSAGDVVELAILSGSPRKQSPHRECRSTLNHSDSENRASHLALIMCCGRNAVAELTAVLAL
jgi:hypothetical protein